MVAFATGKRSRKLLPHSQVSHPLIHQARQKAMHKVWPSSLAQNKRTPEAMLFPAKQITGPETLSTTESYIGQKSPEESHTLPQRLARTANEHNPN